MEPVGAFPDGEWDCSHGMFVTEDFNYSAEFLAQNSLLRGEGDGIKTQSMFLPAPEAGENESMFYSFDALNSNLQYICQESSYSSNSGDTVFIANPGLANYYSSDCDHVPSNTAYMSMDFHMMDEKNTSSFFPSLANIVIEDAAGLSEDRSSDILENFDKRLAEPAVNPAKHVQLKRKLDVPELEAPAEDNFNSSEIQKKKPSVTKDMQGYEKNSQPKKNQKHSQNGNEEEETNTRLDGQSSSSYSSDDDNASQQNSGGETSGSKSPAALNLNGKTRASRGTATDPQSLYARKRREKINERLRILQNLVPNGTKVDISTMLEEAVHYVKFLQLQIKLLSSDDLWMYAPIAYNGMDIGFNLSRKISPTSRA